eukprot:373418-Rhodomonas_salina.1
MTRSMSAMVICGLYLENVREILHIKGWCNCCHLVFHNLCENSRLYGPGLLSDRLILGYWGPRLGPA